MARIKIEDLPVTETITREEAEELLGAGRPSFHPSFEALEDRQMYAANLGAALTPGAIALGNAARGDAQVRTLTPAQEIQMGSVDNNTAPPSTFGNDLQTSRSANNTLYGDIRDLTLTASPALDAALWGGVGFGGAEGASQGSQPQHSGVQDQLGSLDTNRRPLGAGPGLTSTVVPRTGAVNPLLAPTQSAADAAVLKQYEQWKKEYLRDGGNNTLRVARPENQEDTVSEGIGYGMLLAAYHGDKATFDGLWAYARSRLNQNGLMAWHIHKDGHTIDSNAATDADEDMAMALIVADKKWGGYQADAKRLIGNILQHEVEAGTNVLKPGDVWGGSDKTNPSYFAPAYYKAFLEYTGDARWGAVTDKAYEILNKAANPKTGLVPNWVKADGTALDDRQYGYDAMRTPWRIAVDAVWNEDPRAIAYLNKVNAFFKSVGVQNVKDKYNLDGSDPGNTWHNAAGVSMAATAAIVDSDPAYRQSFWNETVNVTHEYNYYNESLRTLSLLLIGNHMTKP